MLPAPTHWFGGKTFLRDFILPHLNYGKVYVEPFCGSANIFFAKRPHGVEVLNDLNPDLINFLRVLQSRRQFRLLAHCLRWTVYSVEEFMLAGRLLLVESTPDVERAWAFFVQKNLGFSGKGVTRGEWRRSFQSGSGNVVIDWQTRVSRLEDWRDRLKNVHIKRQDALSVIRQWDSRETMYYLDPPYVADTRIDTDVYSHEMTDDAHHQLVQLLTTIRGRVVLSGYDTPIYQPLEAAGWARLDRTILSSMARSPDGLGQRTEVLWINRPIAELSLYATASKMMKTPIEPLRSYPPAVDHHRTASHQPLDTHVEFATSVEQASLFEL